jgi:hypothetical protein
MRRPGRVLAAVKPSSTGSPSGGPGNAPINQLSKSGTTGIPRSYAWCPWNPWRSQLQRSRSCRSVALKNGSAACASMTTNAAIRPTAFECKTQRIGRQRHRFASPWGSIPSSKPFIRSRVEGSAAHQATTATVDACVRCQGPVVDTLLQRGRAHTRRVRSFPAVTAASPCNVIATAVTCAGRILRLSRWPR